MTVAVALELEEHSVTREELVTALGDGWALNKRGLLVKQLDRFELAIYFDHKKVYVVMRQPLFFPNLEVMGNSYCFALTYPRCGEALDDIRASLTEAKGEVEHWLQALTEAAE